MDNINYILERIESGPLYKHMERDYSMFFLTAFWDCHTKANVPKYGNGGLTIALMVYKDLISRYYRLEQENEVMCANIADNIYKDPKIKDEIFQNYSEAGEKMMEFYNRIDSENEFNSVFAQEFAKTIIKLITYQVAILHRGDSFVKSFEKTPGVSDEIMAIRKKYESVFGQFETKFELLCQKVLKKYPDATLLDLKHVTYQEFADFLDTGTFPKEAIADRQRLAVISYMPVVEVYTGEKAQRLFDAVQKNESKYHPIENDAKEFLGKTVFGTEKVTGKCQVITDYNKIESLQEGNILVTPSTLPKYNHIYTRAKAIVTNEGSILAHAAILCREFKIPGIIGTKIATNVIKDGSELELDFEKGIVKIIK